jgi:MFS family permease
VWRGALAGLFLAVLWWRWLFLVPAIAMPVLVALSRMYRGEHHPTDVLGSLILAALWLTAASTGDVANAEVSGYSSTHPLPSRLGHGLWVVRQVADRMRVLSGARGTRATVTFNLSGQGAPCWR